MLGFMHMTYREVSVARSGWFIRIFRVKHSFTHRNDSSWEQLFTSFSKQSTRSTVADWTA